MEGQKKQLLIALIILLAAAGIYLAASQISTVDEAEEDITEYTVVDIEADSVTEFGFTNEGEAVKLIRKEDNWELEANEGADIDEEKISGLISKAVPLLSENCIENVEDLSEYGLLEPSKKIMLSDGDNKYTIFVGDYNEITNTYYICLEDKQNTVYTTDSSFVNAFNITIDDITVTEEDESSSVSE